NRDLVASGKTLPHMTPYGGEDRLWLGPEGGQFSLYFKKGEPFDFEHWQTPAPLDTEAWKVIENFSSSERWPDIRNLGMLGVGMSHAMKLTNHAGTTFELRIDRTVH